MRGAGYSFDLKGWRGANSPASCGHAEPPPCCGCHSGAWGPKAAACKRHLGLHASPFGSSAESGDIAVACMEQASGSKAFPGPSVIQSLRCLSEVMIIHNILSAVL